MKSSSMNFSLSKYTHVSRFKPLELLRTLLWPLCVNHSKDNNTSFAYFRNRTLMYTHFWCLTPLITIDQYTGFWNCSCSFLLWCISLCDYVVIYFSMIVWLIFRLLFSLGLFCSATRNISLANILILFYKMSIYPALISLFSKEIWQKILKAVHKCSLHFIPAPAPATLFIISAVL